jgi:hypothetical protein
MASVVQLDKAKRASQKLDPAVREFLDEVFIPALVKKFLLERENQLAVIRGDVQQCEGNLPSAEGVQ